MIYLLFVWVSFPCCFSTVIRLIWPEGHFGAMYSFILNLIIVTIVYHARWWHAVWSIRLHNIGCWSQSNRLISIKEKHLFCQLVVVLLDDFVLSPHSGLKPVVSYYCSKRYVHVSLRKTKHNADKRKNLWYLRNVHLIDSNVDVILWHIPHKTLRSYPNNIYF